MKSRYIFELNLSVFVKTLVVALVIYLIMIGYITNTTSQFIEYLSLMIMGVMFTLLIIVISTRRKIGFEIEE